MMMSNKDRRAGVIGKILDEKYGKGNSDEDLKFSPEKEDTIDDNSNQEMEYAMQQVMKSLSAGDSKMFEHSLKKVISMCLKSKNSPEKEY